MKTITGYVRLANEEHTIIACLESISGIFDKILIIYSEISDKSLELVQNYRKDKSNISIKQYPYSVLPPHSNEYKTRSFSWENSLAAYYDFGISHIDTDLVMKIDADQIYLKDILNDLIQKTIKGNKKNIACRGHNCIVSNGSLMLFKKQPFNGGNDHFIVPTEDAYFDQAEYWEKLKLKNQDRFICEGAKRYWFHFKKGHRFNDVFVSGDCYNSDSLEKMNNQLIEQYEKYVLPLLQNTNSEYKKLKYK